MGFGSWPSPYALKLVTVGESKHGSQCVNPCAWPSLVVPQCEQPCAWPSVLVPQCKEPCTLKKGSVPPLNGDIEFCKTEVLAGILCIQCHIGALRMLKAMVNG
ncbi:hypothetical protein EGR_11239 [Echinococcus granulosus]|uniref:Uncharacterized protein n=1 Tax=Echinococcus granulosus TaxID=6210 RepID=W6UK64_ECHGR|nr:hypothetical protein EGR_11239 [Echinococcus granulosus]EUB53904.1 hypothetical protein EGR_11239 [Echinococcus granulosus]